MSSIFDDIGHQYLQSIDGQAHSGTDERRADSSRDDGPSEASPLLGRWCIYMEEQNERRHVRDGVCLGLLLWNSNACAFPENAKGRKISAKKRKDGETNLFLEGRNGENG